MKTLFVCASAFVLLTRVTAADPDALKFGGEPIGIPPLSLAESAARRTSPPAFQSRLPDSSKEKESPTLAPKLLPRTLPDMMRKSKPIHPGSPQVSSRSGMPVITPSEAVDYGMTIIPPNPRVDFKIVVKDPPYPEKTLPEPGK